MRKISCQLLSTEPVTLSRAAKLITRFSAVENGASPVVANYLHRVADALDFLVQFHSKSLSAGGGKSSARESIEELQPEEFKDLDYENKLKKRKSNETDWKHLKIEKLDYYECNFSGACDHCASSWKFAEFDEYCEGT